MRPLVSGISSTSMSLGFTLEVGPMLTPASSERSCTAHDSSNHDFSNVVESAHKTRKIRELGIGQQGFQRSLNRVSVRLS